MRKLDAHLDARSRSAKEEQSGQVLVLLAVFLIGLLAIMALVFDGGSIYVQRRLMQNSADAGALAGTRTLCKTKSTGQAEAEAQVYAGANGAETAQVTINPYGVTVVACGNLEMTFAQVIGLRWVNVCARASAACKPLLGMSGLRPVAIPWANYDHETTYTIWDDDKDHTSEGSDNISGRGWLNLEISNGDGSGGCSGAGASELSNWMANGYPGFISVGDWICKESGNVASLLIHSVNVGDVIPIIVYDALSADGYYHSVMFAAFEVTGVSKTGNDKFITGHFQYEVKPGEPNPDDPLGDWRTVYLTE